jgi:hypothetical protein
MSQDVRGGDKSPASERRIAGPIPEYNKFGEYTGYTYFRCRNCGAEALNRIDLRGCCGDGGA